MKITSLWAKFPVTLFADSRRVFNSQSFFTTLYMPSLSVFFKFKGRFMGLIQHYGRFRPIVFLSPTSSRIHLQRRHASYRCARPLPAKRELLPMNFASKSVIYGRTRIFYMPQSWNMGQILLLPLRMKAY